MVQTVALFDATPQEVAYLREAGALDVRPHAVASDLRDAEVAVVFSFADLPPDLFREAPNLKWIVSLPAGADHIPFEQLPPGCGVVSMHGPNATAIAEHALALLFAAFKHIVPHAYRLAAGAFDQDRASRRIAGARALVIGAGAIGGEIARLAGALGMRVDVCRASARAHPHAARTFAPDELSNVWGDYDALFLAVPLSDATRGMVDATALANMRAGAVLVNVARGKLVDRDALVAHLDTHDAFVYATDVWWRYPRDDAWDEPLARHEGVVGTPHVAGVVPEWRLEMVKAARDAVTDILSGKTPRGRIERAQER